MEKDNVQNKIHTEPIPDDEMNQSGGELSFGESTIDTIKDFFDNVLGRDPSDKRDDNGGKDTPGGNEDIWKRK